MQGRSARFTSHVDPLKTMNLEEELADIVQEHSAVYEVLQIGSELNLSNWYIGAGCITQSVWNKYHNYPINQNILDIDLVFYEPNEMDKSYEEEVHRKILQNTKRTGTRD